jgi:NOL1/NOP2/fmu family ribosome biogenesis protein
MKVEILDKAKKKRILQKIEKEYGISEMKELLVQTGKEKLRIYSGSLSREELNELGKNLNVEILGMQFLKSDNERVRLNFDVLNLPNIKKQIKSYAIFFLPDEDVKHWMNGGNIANENFDFPGNYVLIENGGDFLGMGQISKDTIKNYIPKERRTKLL